MWDLGNRGAVVLFSVTCGCVLIYNAWGVILALAFSLLLVVYACYSLLVNDSLISPHAYHLLLYLWEAFHELQLAVKTAVRHGTGHLHKLWYSASRCYRERFLFIMDKQRRGNYQLSSDSYVCSRDSSSSSPLPSRFSLINQLSPIARDTYRSRINDTLVSENKFYQVGDYGRSQQFNFAKHTSTPMFKHSKEESKNGDVGQFSPPRVSSKKSSPPLRSQNHTLNRGENVTQFSPEGSPWGTSISPKMRARAAGMKTVQTVAGPLLASTRYNIDPKVYTDVLSPGLTTRLTKYAIEANNKLTHQCQYGTGQYPKVNIHASSLPIVNIKSAKMKSPVTVRVAAPDVVVRSERRQRSSNMFQAKNKSPTSVAQVLREISLKRHASTEDVTFDMAKKQRTETVYNEEREIIEETKQKRSRDDSSKSEEELSPQNKCVRPAKRTKTLSCYDILNSLSSSIHVASGVKRKAIDFSRSGTPDFEKHFKSLENSQNSSSVSPQFQDLDLSHCKQDFQEIYSRSPKSFSCDKMQESPLIKGILKTSNNESEINLKDTSPTIPKNDKNSDISNIKIVSPIKPIKLAEKLFMKVEPERNRRFMLLVEEQGNIKANFSTDNVEEIKKEDIRNMRQTSMKARLQSMFDAIAGKVESRINPGVVIQADDVNNTVTPVTDSTNCATLNSSTTTTTINTTPISTAAIVPGGVSTSKPDTKSTTNTALSVSNVISPIPPKVSTVDTVKIKETSPRQITKADGSISQQQIVSTATMAVSTAPLQTVVSSTANVVPIFSFGKPTTVAPVMTSSPVPNVVISTSSSNIITSTPIAAMPISSTSNNFLVPSKTSLSKAFAPVNSTITPKIETNNITTTKISLTSTSTNTQAKPTFTFGNSKLTSPPPSTMPKLTTSSNIQSQSTGMILPINTPAVSVTTFNSVTNSTSSSLAITSASVPGPLFTFGNNNASSQPPKSDIFVFGQSCPVPSAKSLGKITNNQITALPQDTNKTFNFTSNTLATTAASNSFNTNVTTASPAFGLSNTPSFSLGTSTTSTTTSKALFVFGSNSESTSTTTTNNIMFGPPSNNVTTTFGAPTTIASLFGTTATSITTPSVVTTNMFNTINSPAVFGISTSGTGIFNAPKITTATMFSPTTNTSSTNNTASVSLFPNVTANPNSTIASSMFGTNTTIFGQTKSSTSFGTGSGAFGNTATSLFTSSTTSVPTFNITSVSTSTNSSAFDNTSNVTSAFGTPSVGTVNAQSTSAPTFGGSSTMFGSTDNTSAPIFGANTTSATGAFSSSGTNTFGPQNPPNLTFGTATSSSTFGDKTPFGASATTTSFGTPAASVSTFGTNNANNANNANMFFGNNQKTGPQNSSFSFASNFNAGNNSVTVSTAPFQFGSTSSKPGFNFTAPSAPTAINFTTSGIPTFNASAPGMFSIGSGSTVPRSRTIRTRKPR